jgi:hypothetical protein
MKYASTKTLAQTRTLPSLQAVAKRFPAGLNRAQKTFPG